MTKKEKKEKLDAEFTQALLDAIPVYKKAMKAEQKAAQALMKDAMKRVKRDGGMFGSLSCGTMTEAGISAVKKVFSPKNAG